MKLQSRPVFFVTLCWALLSMPAAAQTAKPAAAFALVVAHNRSNDASVKALRYADDDGARFYELMAAVARRTELLVVLDSETQKTFSGLTRVARAPSRAELSQAMARLRKAMLAARKQGLRTVFYFYYAGHGDVGSDREGYINLLDGRFSRSDLYREVIARSPADLNHIIIDACNAYFLVNRRGAARRGSEAYQRAMRSFLARESLERYPNTGVVLSTASMAETHEWSRYRSGIFSHQLLSALWGSADVDGDRAVSYRELSAYVAAANLRVRDSRARLSIYARAPSADHQASLVNLKALRRAGAGKVGPTLAIPRAMQGHYYLEDDRGVRHLDFNKSAEQPLKVALLNRPYYYLRSADRESMIRPGQQAEIDAGQLTFAELPTRSRGSVEQSFRRDLYAYPFGRSFATGYTTARQVPAPPAAALLVADVTPRPWYARAGTWKWVTVGTAAAAVTTGVVLQVLAAQTDDELESGAGQITMARAVELQQEGNSRRAAAGVAWGIAGTAVLTSVVLFVVDRHQPRPQARPARVVGFAAGPDGGSLSLSGAF